MMDKENEYSVFVGYADHTCNMSGNADKRLTIGVNRDDSCNTWLNTDTPYTVSTYRYDTCYTGDTSGDTTGRQFISDNLEDTLKTYDSDQTDKTLRFNGYQSNMNGKWYRVKEEGESIYYFEKD